jgi:WD40 repeat protein
MLKARRIKRMPGVNYIAFAPDGRRLAAAMSDRTMRVWDLQRREETVLVPPPLSNLKCLDFSPDGQCLAAGTWMNDAPDYCKVLVWRLDTGDLQVLSGHRNGINDVRYAADGSTIASASTDGTVRLWSSATGDSLAVIQVADGRMHGVNRVRFTADDAALILVLSGPNSDSDGAVWIHDLASGVRTRMPDDDDPQALARRLPPRYRGLVRSFQDLTEFVVKDADTGDAIAWSSLSLGDFLTHPSGRMWAGASGVLTLEDPPDRG